MIADEELRNLFKVASEEHLQKLDQGILQLEKAPEDKTPLEELLREAHSLKGDARMLEVKDVETLIHEVEHLLIRVNHDEINVTSELCDRVWQALDAIRKLVTEATTGEPSEVNTFNVLARLIGANPNAVDQKIEADQNTNQDQNIVLDIERTSNNGNGKETVATPLQPEAETEPIGEEETIPEETEAEPTAEIDPPSETSPSSHTPYTSHTPHTSPTLPSPKPYRIETIRVPTHNLDALMTQAGELTVTKIRIEHRLQEIEQIVTLWEEWSRDNFTNRFALDNLSHNGKSNGNGNGRNQLTQLKGFYTRNEQNLEQLGEIISRLRAAASEDTARLDSIADELEEGIRTLRLLPLSTIFQLFPRLVRDLAKQEGKQVDLILEGSDTKADKRILEEMKDPLMHMIRNCIDHGIEPPAERESQGKPPTAKLVLRGYQTTHSVIIEVEDDGKGLNTEKIKQTALKRGLVRAEDLDTLTPDQIHQLIFEPGFSTRTFVTEVSGRGVGLDVVRTNVERLKGTIQVDSTPGKGTRFKLQLGTTLATAHVLIVEVDHRSYAIPVEFVLTTQMIRDRDIFTIEGRETILIDNEPLSIARLEDLLELPTPLRGSSPEPGETVSDQLFCTVLQVGNERLGLIVDQLLDEQDVVLKPQSKLLKRVRNVAGATILGTGEVCMILNPQDLVKSVQKQTSSHRQRKPKEATETHKPVILLAEDSITTRTQEKRILTSAGYEVVTAVDGLDAFNKLKTRNFDAVVSDVQMPNLDGFGFTEKIRQHPQYNELPVILVTSLASDEDKRKGAEAGANAYITKGAFNQDILLKTLSRLI